MTLPRRFRVGAGVMGGAWALFRGHRHRMGRCALLPAVSAGPGDLAGWGRGACWAAGTDGPCGATSLVRGGVSGSGPRRM